MVRVVGGGEIVGVAAKAGDRCSGEAIPYMALRAGQSGVRPRQRKPRDLAVIEPSPLPHVHAVTALTGGGKTRRHMVQRGRCLIIPQVAGHALRAQPGINTSRGAVMTVVAGRGGMRANEREAVVMIANGGNLHIPPANAMALLAIGSELAAMQIGMALGTACRSLGKVQVHMATGARHILVLP